MRFRQVWLPIAVCAALVGWQLITLASDPRQRPGITTHNIAQLKQIATLGRGQIVNIAWSPNSRWAAVATTAGIWIYDAAAPQTEPKRFGTDDPQAIAFSEDSQLISSAGWNDAVGGVLIQTWAVDTQKQVLRVENPYLNSPILAFSAAGDLLGVFRSDGSAQLWRIPSGESIATFQLGSFWNIAGIALSPDNAFIGVTGDNGDYGAGKVIVRATGVKRMPPIYRQRTGFFLFSPDGKHLTASLGDVKLFRPETGALTATVEASRISQIKTWDDGSLGRNFSYSADSTHLAVITGKADEAIRLWNVDSQATEHLFVGHTKEVSAVELSADGQTLFSSSFDGTVRVWNTTTGHQKALLKGNDNGQYAVFVSPNAERIVSPDVNGELWLWNVGTGALVARWGGFIERISMAAFSPDSVHLAVSSASDTVNASGNPWAFGRKPGRVRVWDWETGALRTAFEEPSVSPYVDSFVSALAYRSGGHTLCLSSFSSMACYDASTLQIQKNAPQKVAGRIEAISGAGRYFAVTVYNNQDWFNGIVDVYSMMTANRIASLQLPNIQVDKVVFSPDGKLLLINTYGSGTDRFEPTNKRTLLLFDVTSNRVIQRLENPFSSMNVFAISNDLHIVATGGQQNSVYLWDVVSGLPMGKIATNALAVDKLLFNADGSLLFVVTNLQTEIYDVHRRAIVRELKQRPTFLTLNNDGSLLAAGADDGTVKVWAIVHDGG